MSTPQVEISGFAELGLAPELLSALEEVGYERPSPIQAQAIPSLLEGADLLGHAPTGTGKTAAFALPLLNRLDIADTQVQVMTLTPTRELAIQVAEAYQTYASHIRGFHVVPIYGGQDYSIQLRQLKRGVHVVVGTPGRVMDHMRRGTLKLGGLRALVLDEADEMLRMGFIDEVEWILEQTPAQRQMALFSATMPKEIERIARRHLREPREISIKTGSATAETIRQRYWLVGGLHKLDALTRILEVETIDGVLIFVRTKTATTELANRLEARGYSAAAMNGDLHQKQREQMVARLKKGSLDILVATDVAARGLDVDRISHVINYDIPYDTEAYIHRIGRTGRAGREGDAILFVAPRERRMLNAIERATRQKIEPLELPTTEVVNNKRIADFKQQISDTLAADDHGFMQGVLEQYQQEHDVPALEIAAALASMAIGDRLLLVEGKRARREQQEKRDRPERSEPRKRRETTARTPRVRREPEGADRRPNLRPRTPVPADFERFRIEVGLEHGVEPRNIVGAIANEAGLDAEHIGRIEIDTSHSMVELPAGMPREIFRDLKKVWVCGKQLGISRIDADSTKRSRKSAASEPGREVRKHKAGPKTEGKRKANSAVSAKKNKKKKKKRDV